MSTDTSLSDLNLRLMDTIAPVAGHKGKITSVSSRLPGKRFNGNPVHLKKIETEDDLEYLLQICKNSFVVNKDIYRVDVFVKFEPLNIEEEYGKDVAQFLAKLKNDKAYEAEVLAGLEELNQEEWEEDIFQMDEDIALEQLAANASEACNASSEFPYGSGLPWATLVLFPSTRLEHIDPSQLPIPAKMKIPLLLRRIFNVLAMRKKSLLLTVSVTSQMVCLILLFARSQGLLNTMLLKKEALLQIL
eukprot:jgi/Picre1/31990/NNA_007338.t1